MNYTEQLEQDTERTRRDLANTIEELRNRLTPGQVLDEVLDYVGDSGVGDYLRSFRQQVVANPLPVGLMGASIAWMVVASALGGRNSADTMTGFSRRDMGRSTRVGAQGLAADARDRTVERGRGFGDRAGELSANAADRTAEMGRGLADRAADMGRGFADRAADLRTDAADRAAGVAGQAMVLAGRAGERMRNAADAASAGLASASDSVAASAKSGARAIGETAGGIGRNSRAAGRAVADFGREQPMILAATGIVIGALIGALLPRTETEDRLIGESSDAAKDKLRALASEQYSKATDGVIRSAGAALDENATSAEGSTERREGTSRADEATHRDEGSTLPGEAPRVADEFGPGPGPHQSGDHGTRVEGAEHAHSSGGD